jgi:hypothetical protein
MSDIAAPTPLVGPTPGEGVTHLLFRCLRHVLLHTELLIPLMFRFSANVGHAGFLVFFHSPRYRALRGLIVGEAVVTLATPEYSFRFPLASATRTRYL